MTSVYYAIPAGPMSALPELGPGSPSLPGNPIGSGIIVATSSTAAAAVELRVNNTNGPQYTMEILAALERLRWFVRQRGFIGGSGGPSGNPPTNTQPVGITPV